MERTPSGATRVCGWTGPDEQEAQTWVREMQQCFPENTHWFQPVAR